jgi:uncharacterized membrane protein
MFFGFILASVFLIWMQSKRYTYQEYILTLLGIIVGLLVSFLSPGQENDNLFFVFFCGMISISGMILPGLSGSFLILILGNYTLLLVDSVNALYFTLVDLASLNFSFTDNPNRMELLGVILIFALGSLTGLLVLSKVLRWLLLNHKEKIIATLVGFILGSLSASWPWKRVVKKNNYDLNPDRHELFWPKFDQSENIYVILFIFLGFGIVTLLEIYGKKSTKN